MKKASMTALITLLCFFSFVSVAFANRIPWDPWRSFFNLEVVEYVSIFIAEFCGFVVGTVILVHYGQVQWKRASLTLFVAVLMSYVLGIVLWTLGYQIGIITYPLPPLGIIMLWLPEFVGTAVGSIIIKRLQKTTWRIALITMIAAMVTSLLIGLLLGYIHLILSTR